MSKKRKAWRASQQRKVEAAPEHTEAEIPPHRLRGLARREWINQQVEKMYAQMVGDSIDVAIRACRHTADAFNSQMAEVRGEGEAWGPDVSVYESRMTGSLLARLQREKRTWLREMRQQVEEALAEEAAMEAEKEEAGARRASDGYPHEETEDAQTEAPMHNKVRGADALSTGEATRATIDNGPTPPPLP
jgi:hypothetical protein